MSRFSGPPRSIFTGSVSPIPALIPTLLLGLLLSTSAGAQTTGTQTEGATKTLRGGKRTASAGMAICGTYQDRAEQELFLHERNLAKQRQRGLQREAMTLRSAAAADLDVGDIAVIRNTDGIVASRNDFNLNGFTVTFTPGALGYQVSSTNDNSYDQVAALAGTRIPLGDDDTTEVSLPFSLPFFGTTYTSGWLNSNGSLSFGRGIVESEYLFYGEFPAGPPSIAPLYTDLVPNESSTGVVMLSEADRVVISWHNVPLYSTNSSGPQRFQIRLYPDGAIEFAYAFADPAYAVAGITGGNLQPSSLIDFASTASGGPYTGGIGDSFSSIQEVDIVSAAQRFYRTHDDGYDYLVIYNALDVNAGPGAVAYEITTRSQGSGYGDSPTDWGSSFGSAKNLKAVMNMGQVSQYPLDPGGIVLSRGVVGDTPLSVLGHEAGHLWLALTSVPNPEGPSYNPPMLTSDMAHWAFPFNSDASLLQGNRIVDNGIGANPQFRTIGTVEHYSALDQYLMGLRAPNEVDPTFAILHSGQSNDRPPQVNITMNGDRFDIGIEDVVATAGRRTPDSTVSQRAFRFAFLLIVEPDADLSSGSVGANAIAQIDTYRQQFENYFHQVSDGRATADTRLLRSVQFSLHPNSGLVLGEQETAQVSLAQPAAESLTLAIATQNAKVQAPSSVTIPAGESSKTFAVTGNAVGVEEFLLTPSSTAYAPVTARVQVNPRNSLALTVTSGDKQRSDLLSNGQPLPEPLEIRVVDQNQLPYAGQAVNATVTSGGSLSPASATSDADGIVRFTWTPAPGNRNYLTATLAGEPTITTTASALGQPAIASGGVVQAASYTPHLAPGAFGSAFGASLAAGALGSASSPFPTNLAGVGVLINGVAAGVVYVSDTQINFLAPSILTPGPGQLHVVNGFGTSADVPVTIDPAAPGIFYDAPTGYGAILISGTTNVTQVQPAHAGDYLEIYTTGLGQNPDASVTIGGVSVPVTYAGGTVIDGLQQVNVQITAGVPAGTQSLQITLHSSIGDVQSNTVQVEIR